MKKQVLFFLVLFISAASFSFVEGKNVKIEKRKIDRDIISTKSLVYIPVCVEQENDLLSILFEAPIGEVTIIIENAVGGVEYSISLDTATENYYSIDLEQFVAGDYLLVIECDEYALLGEFTIE